MRRRFRDSLPTGYYDKYKRQRGSAEYSWMNMKQRCLNQNYPRYSDYGGRGITICDEWMTFAGFHQDMGDRPSGKTLDRIDNDGPYCKENCKWSTPTEQAHNRRKRRQQQ